MNRNFSDRKYIIIILILTVGFIFTLRLFFIQVLDQSYLLSAESNATRHNTIYPHRGLIYDRNGELLVYDEAAYDLMVIPGQVEEMDTLEFCQLLNISDSTFKARLRKAKNWSTYKPSTFVAQITKEEFGFIEEKLYKYPGFFVQSRSLRKYPQPIAAHLLGYIGEVNNREIEKDAYYRSGDYIGKSGLERFYEKELRGKKGVKIVMVDVHNREQGSYRDGKYDTVAVPGETLYLSLDAGLQAYGEQLMQNKIGSVVAIDPRTGEIVAFITSPTYDPNLLVGRIRSENYSNLSQDSLKPLLNRAIMGTYPPGSTFKMVNALVGLQEGVLHDYTAYSCYGPASTPIRCTHDHISPLELQEAIEQSCNPYFWNVFRSIISNPKYPTVVDAFNVWRDDVTSIGFGKKFNTDIPFEQSGNIPTAELYDKIYTADHWNALTIRSLAIGQGEILVTPLQLANLSVVIANKGFYYPPHLVSAIGTPDAKIEAFNERIKTNFDEKYFDVVQQAMLEVFEGEHGTARWAKLEGVDICGKTGTVQNPHGKDHSMFIAFAPKDDPKIALSVIVENSGYGSTWAAPIASLLIEKYLNDTISRPQVEKRILDGNLIPK
ncbi:MAG TPA: penicillin-binding protein 2 [Bacteroidales bacterium]|nr:penicillin-binding protein 2 [Bacteroidales bacterium]HRX95327.1 penicillin-binding protein 2 [Bacteroidales bacterium]